MEIVYHGGGGGTDCSAASRCNYGNLMSNLLGGRTNQKLRTHIALVESAAQLMREGKSFTVAEVADRAKVGRTTAYRYFPTVEQLMAHASLHAITEVEKQMIGAAVANTSSADERLREVVEASDKSVTDHEFVYRAMLRESLNEKNSEDDGLPRRSGARKSVIDAAIGALRKELGEKRYEKLTAVLSLFIGIEAEVVLRDVCLLSREKAREVKLWGAKMILEAALAELSSRASVRKAAPNAARSANPGKGSSNSASGRR
jgi:AcrR family transcriptional regulator